MSFDSVLVLTESDLTSRLVSNSKECMDYSYLFHSHWGDRVSSDWALEAKVIEGNTYFALQSEINQTYRVLAFQNEVRSTQRVKLGRLIFDETYESLPMAFGRIAEMIVTDSH